MKTRQALTWMRFAGVHTVGAGRVRQTPRATDRASTVDVIPASTSSTSRDRSYRVFSSRVAPLSSKIVLGARAPTLQPRAPETPSPTRSGRTERCWSADAVADRATTVLRRLHDLWEKLQVSHCGKYSIERMMELDEYSRSASNYRVAVVCLLAPLPALLVVVLMEFLPLSPPDAGCLGNYVFWVRHWFAVGVILWTGIIQAKQWIPELPLSQTRMIVMSFTCSGVYVALNVLAGYLWVFPIPFLAVLGGIVMFPIWVVGIVLAVGYQTLVNIPDIRDRLQRFLYLQSAESSLMILYPVNNAVFQAVPSSLRSAYMVVLPVINLAMKNVVAAKGSHLEDRLPETVVFSVDVFSALYSVFCMRSANTLSSVSVAVAIDAVFIVLAVHGMHRRTLFTQELILETTPPAKGPTRRHAISAGIATKSDTASLPFKVGMVGTPIVSHMLAKALDLLQRPGQLDADDLREIRLLSGTKHTLSLSNMELLCALEKRAIYDNARTPTNRVSFSQIKARYSSGSVQKVGLQHQTSDGSLKLTAGQRIATAIRKSGALVAGFLKNVNEAASPSPLTRESQVLLHPLLKARHPALKDALQLVRKKNTAAVHEVLQLLFSSEYLVLIAYVQCIIPPMFILYMSALHNLPNLAYYPRAAELLFDDQLRRRLDTITFYWGLELFLLLAVHLVLRRKFALATMYQIAFVLESHALLVQCKLIFTLIFAVQSAAVHYGADYTFRFEWIRHHSLGSG